MLNNFIKFILGFIFFLTIQFCRLFINIRIGKFPSSRIGPFITTVEILAARKKELNTNSFDIWAHNKAQEPNKFLSKMVSREIKFINHYFYSFIEYFFNVLKIKEYKKTFFLKPYTRDTMNLFDNYSNVLKFSIRIMHACDLDSERSGAAGADKHHTPVSK